MNRVYISERGNDKNDGRTPETPVYSWERALKLCDGNTEAHLMDGPTLQRLNLEIERAPMDPLSGVEAAATGLCEPRMREHPSPWRVESVPVDGSQQVSIGNQPILWLREARLFRFGRASCCSARLPH